MIKRKKLVIEKNIKLNENQANELWEIVDLQGTAWCLEKGKWKVMGKNGTYYISIEIQRCVILMKMINKCNNVNCLVVERIKENEK